MCVLNLWCEHTGNIETLQRSTARHLRYSMTGTSAGIPVPFFYLHGYWSVSPEREVESGEGHHGFRVAETILLNTDWEASLGIHLFRPRYTSLDSMIPPLGEYSLVSWLYTFCVQEDVLILLIHDFVLSFSLSPDFILSYVLHLDFMEVGQHRVS